MSRPPMPQFVRHLAGMWCKRKGDKTPFTCQIRKLIVADSAYYLIHDHAAGSGIRVSEKTFAKKWETLS